MIILTLFSIFILNETRNIRNKIKQVQLCNSATEKVLRNGHFFLT